MGGRGRPIQKGQVLNPKGRGKGTPNKTTKEMKDFIASVLSENLDKMREDFDKMSPATRWTLLEKFGKYVIPTLAQSQVNAEVNGDINIKISFEEDSDDKKE